MRKVLLSAIAVTMLLVSFAGVAAAEPMSPGQVCSEGLRDYVSWVLEQALYDAHGVEVDIDISQGACVSTLVTHMSEGGVNTQALATSFCQDVAKEFGITGPYVPWCVEHVQPALLGIFHGG